MGFYTKFLCGTSRTRRGATSTTTPYNAPSCSNATTTNTSTSTPINKLLIYITINIHIHNNIILEFLLPLNRVRLRNIMIIFDNENQEPVPDYAPIAVQPLEVQAGETDAYGSALHYEEPQPMIQPLYNMTNNNVWDGSPQTDPNLPTKKKRKYTKRRKTSAGWRGKRGNTGKQKRSF
eukprot:UN03882